MRLKLEKPLVFFDIEATGVDPHYERILDIFLLKVHPNGKEETLKFRFNPERPIPPASTKVHGITDADVKNAPSFAERAPKIADFMRDCDLAGYGILHYDIPLLHEEFKRAGMPVNMEGVRVVDALRIFQFKEPRTLTAAYKKFCGKDLEDAHAAEADIRATAEVLDGMLAAYDDLPRDADGLDLFCRPDRDSFVDPDGKFHWVEGEVTFTFGKHKGQALKNVVREDPGYLQWMAGKADFPDGVKTIIRDALAGKLPEREA